MRRKRTAVIGAAGVAGQQLAALARHPWFAVTALAASERSAGKTCADAITDAGAAFRWYCQEPLDPSFARMPVQDAAKLDASALDVIALDGIDNVVPYIPKEEEKVETETRKILGAIAGDTVEPACW